MLVSEAVDGLCSAAKEMEKANLSHMTNRCRYHRVNWHCVIMSKTIAAPWLIVLA